MKILIFFITFFASNSIAIAQNCPKPPTAIDPIIETEYEYSKTHKDYTYTYKISNGVKAKVNLYLIKIESEENVDFIHAPKFWNMKYAKTDGNNPSTFSIMSGTEEINPGGNAIVFKIKSKLEPGITRIYTEGHPSNQVKAITTNGDNESTPTCPGFFTEEKSASLQRKNGVTIGPVPANQVEMKFKMKVSKTSSPTGTDDEAENPEISPVDEGEIDIFVYKAGAQDLGTIDLKSFAYGPYKTTPYYAALTNIKTTPRIIWRNKPDEVINFIHLKFKLADLKIRCDLDTALVLTAKTPQKNLIGYVNVRPKMCEKHLMEAHFKKLQNHK